ANKSEVTFYRLDGVSTDATNDFMAIATLGGLAIAGTGDPLSAAGLAWQPVVGIVHAFVALEDKVGMGARVWHVVLGPQSNLPKPSAVSGLTDGYSASPFVYPSALYAGNQPYAAWINADGSVALSDGTSAMPQKLAVGADATTVSLLLYDDNTSPAVLYTLGGGGVVVEAPGIPPNPLAECQPAPGDYLSSSATYTNIPGVWLGGWTKYGSGYLTTNGRALWCSAADMKSGMGCRSDTNPCPDDSEANLARNPATVVVHRPGDATTLMEVVQATPVITTDGTNITASILLTQQSVDLGPVPLQSKTVTKSIGDPITLASAPTTSDDYAGPDWPAVAFVPPDRFAVAWTEPAAAGPGDELRVQRYKMCLPAPN
ncbi:MAG TPA: hypothetical protein VMI54_06785, partial [Polyangiaceae bacterium]|nr:hypothetical protein [Polyangiaceae bacterium]